MPLPDAEKIFASGVLLVTTRSSFSCIAVLAFRSNLPAKFIRASMSTTSDRAFVTTRLFKASPALIFRAFSEPERLARWWGPNGFSNTFHAFDFKPGGLWHLDMHGPDGTTYPNKSVFEEVTPQRIVLRHLETVHQFTLAITLAEEQGGTRLTWEQTFDSVEECDKVRAYVPRCNEENLDRLESELARLTAGDRELVLMRIVDVPREKLYRCWTEAELLKQWFAPLPYTTPVAQLDVRPGGSSLVVMRGPDGTDMPNPGVYLEVVPNERLVATDAYTKAWEPSEKPFMTVVLTFEKLGDSRTRYTARVIHWSAADRAMHEKMGFYPGWGQCLDQLVALAQTL